MALYIDPEDALKRMNNNARLYGMLLKKFNGREMLETLKSNISAGNSEEGKMTAHTIKGLAANLSLPELRRISEEAEKKFKDGDCSVDIGQFSECVDITMEKINEYIASKS